MPITRSTISPRPTLRRPAGFTLMEILIALSIFGAGLVMAASLFPAGVSEHQKAIEYTLGTIMCNNGLAIARTQLQHNATNGTPNDPSGILTALQPYPTWKDDPPVKVVAASTSDPLYQIKIECSTAAPDPANAGKYLNSYTITVTPYKAGSPFPGTPTPPSLVVKMPLKP